MIMAYLIIDFFALFPKPGSAIYTLHDVQNLSNSFLLYPLNSGFNLLLLTLSFQGMVNSSGEPAHIKEALSRLVVELIKREWPQNWGSLLPELNNICGFGVHFAINMKLIYSAVQRK